VYTIFLLHLVQKAMNFTYSTKICPDGKYGSRNSEGNWNGMIREVMDGNADMR
jgi:hypothetical protein